MDYPCWRHLYKVRTFLFFVKKLRKLSTPAEFICKFVEVCVLPLLLYCSPAIFDGLLIHGFALLKRSTKLVKYVVLVSANLQTLSVTVTSRCSPNLLRGFVEIVSTLYTMTYQRQGHTLPAGTVSSCCPRRLLYIGTLFSRLLVDRNAERSYYIQNLSWSYSAFANSCPLQTDTFLFPLIHSHNAILSSNKF